MYHPTSRVLTVLELLQARPFVSGPELATILEVEVRTVRRYIAILQDIGIPIEANVGRHGGYRLRPGFKLPPLMFSEEEATALILGLLGTAWLELGQPSGATEGALAKILRVLPVAARERLAAISSHLFVSGPQSSSQPAVTMLLAISEAIGEHQRLIFDYRSGQDRLTRRKVEPYGVVARNGRWFLVAYCCLRQDFRTFRLDRIQALEGLTERFEPVADFDYRAYLLEQPSGADSFAIKVEFQATLFTVQQKIPASNGTLSAGPQGVLFETNYEDVKEMARYLMSLALPFVVHQPPELRQALMELASEMVQRASQTASL